MPAGVDHLSFGMNMGSTGSFTVDDYWEQDNGAPTVTAVNPQDGDTNVGTGSSVTLTFSNAMDHASTENAFSLATQADGSSSVPGTFAWSADSTQMTFNPSAALKTSTVYRVNEASSAQDISGDRLTAGKTVNFTTAPIAGFVLQNASLEKDANTDGVPDCWQTDGYGTNTFAFSRTSDSHTGDVAENLNMTAWTNGDRKLVVKQDAGTCSPPITAGHTYQLSAWYKSTSPTWFVVYTRNPSNGAWGYWKGSPVFPASSTWKQVTWTTPAAPSGVDRFSFGLNTGSVGSITTDDYWEQDTAP
jgi:hypothetical protein